MATAKVQSETRLQFMKMETLKFSDKKRIIFFSNVLLFDCVWGYRLSVLLHFMFVFFAGHDFLSVFPGSEWNQSQGCLSRIHLNTDIKSEFLLRVPLLVVFFKTNPERSSGRDSNVDVFSDRRPISPTVSKKEIVTIKLPLKIFPPYKTLKKSINKWSDLQCANALNLHLCYLNFGFMETFSNDTLYHLNVTDT